MTATMTATPVTSCPDCGEPVIRSASLLLTPERVVGGLYDVGPGLRKRRPLTHIAREMREHRPVYGGGHDPHECPLPLPWWAER
jgi:hypothetical protein